MLLVLQRNLFFVGFTAAVTALGVSSDDGDSGPSPLITPLRLRLVVRESPANLDRVRRFLRSDLRTFLGPFANLHEYPRHYVD